MLPDYWSEFIHSNSLIGKEISIPASCDLSELNGGILKIFDENEIIEESNDYYPGIGVRQFGYVAIACCMNGSGHPYFINSNDGADGKLYRIYHDADMLDENTYDVETAVNVVLKNYSEILKFVG